MPGCYKHRKAQCASPCEWKVGVGCREPAKLSPSPVNAASSTSKSPAKPTTSPPPTAVGYKTVYTAPEVNKYLRAIGSSASTEASKRFNEMCSYMLSGMFVSSSKKEYSLADMKKALPANMHATPDTMKVANVSKRFTMYSYQNRNKEYINFDKECIPYIASFLEGLLKACWAPAARLAGKRVEMRHLFLSMGADEALRKLFKVMTRRVGEPKVGAKPVYDDALIMKVGDQLHPDLKIGKECIPWINGMVRPLLDMHKTVLAVYPKGSNLYRIAKDDMKTDERMLEYLLAEILELAGTSAFKAKSKTIRVAHLEDAVVRARENNEFFKLYV